MTQQKVIIEQVKALIHKERSNTILEHLKTWFHGDENHYFGNITGNKFQIWRFTRGAQGFHPVIHGEVLTDQYDEPTINLRPVLNPLGYVQSVVGILGIIILTIYILPYDTSLFIGFLIAFGLTMTIAGIVYFIYRYETKHHMEQLKERLNRYLISK